ncbi:MAG: peptide/nickel transport system permease protein, partial [Thermomicrobiales bacterium]|nr:peptide/nickel transport system permease protein [Thermomicrobiales bacterium]
FSIPGMGRLGVESIFYKDSEVVLGIALVSGVLGLLANLAADILYAVADPRIRYD